MMSSEVAPAYKKFVREGWVRAQVFEFLEAELARAGFHGADIVHTPVRTVITVYVERPGMVIGKGGRRSRRLSEALKRKFGFENPYLRAEKVEEPFLSARIVASYIARRIERGERHKRVAFAALRRVMAAGARGVEIRIAGKFGGQRAREERFRAGVIYRCGEDPVSSVEYATRHVLLPQGMLGIRVRIVKPSDSMPDKISLKQEVIEKLLEEIRGPAEEAPAEEAPVPEELEEALAEEGEGGGESVSEEGGRAEGDVEGGAGGEVEEPEG
ncbi:MAG: 30S ribosomal protein S3 [Thermoproteota archaeon]|nr:MAG: 30S ribosomal protein S3 [Candidatus Korarchaeota archaeon]